MSKTQNWSRENLAWAGGLFEGEGCISIKPWGSTVLRLEMSDEDTVRRFAGIIGFGKISEPRLHGPNHKPTRLWTLCTSRHVIAVIAALWPFLGQRRQDKCREAMLAARDIGVANKYKSHCRHGHEYTEENVYLSQGKRSCKECSRIKSKKAYYKKKNNGSDQLHHSANGARVGDSP